MRKRLARQELAAYVANIPPCTLVMESCGGGNCWARVFQRSGHTVKLISPQFVKPFVMTNKNDANDAQAIVDAAIGLDVRVRESGRFKGQRKLTKKGSPEIRRLLFNAARAGARTTQWKPYYDSLRDRRLTTTSAAVAISLKIVKLAFALMRDQTEYRVRIA